MRCHARALRQAVPSSHIDYIYIRIPSTKCNCIVLVADIKLTTIVLNTLWCQGVRTSAFVSFVVSFQRCEMLLCRLITLKPLTVNNLNLVSFYSKHEFISKILLYCYCESWFPQDHGDGNFNRPGLWAIESPSTGVGSQPIISGKYLNCFTS